MNSDQLLVHHRHHKVTYTAVLLGLMLIAAGLANQFYLASPMYHSLGGYVLIVPGITLILRAMHPPIGFMRVLTTLIGGVCLGASPMFFKLEAPDPPWIFIGLVLCGMMFLGGSFTIRTKVHKHH